MNILWHDWAGYLGVVLVLLAFLLLQARKLHGNGLVYQLMNVLGALGVMANQHKRCCCIGWRIAVFRVTLRLGGIRERKSCGQCCRHRSTRPTATMRVASHR